MKLVDLDTKITALLWDDEHGEKTEREMTVGEFLDEFTVEGLLETPLYFGGGVARGAWEETLYGWECMVCVKEQQYARRPKFCPNCGADMKEES